MTKRAGAVDRAAGDRVAGRFSTGIGSPVIIDSSTALAPSRPRRRPAPSRPAARAADRPAALRRAARPRPRRRRATRRAVFGARPSSARIAAPVRLRARSSSTWPSSTSVMITAAASKYTADVPRRVAERRRKEPGRQRRDHAVDVGHADAERDQREHVRAAVHDDATPRTKNGQPPTDTTGVASASSIQSATRRQRTRRAAARAACSRHREQRDAAARARRRPRSAASCRRARGCRPRRA